MRALGVSILLASPAYPATIADSGARILFEGVVTEITLWQDSGSDRVIEDLEVYADTFRVGQTFHGKVRLRPDRATQVPGLLPGTYRVPMDMRVTLAGQRYQTGPGFPDYWASVANRGRYSLDDSLRMRAFHSARTFDLGDAPQTGEMAFWMFDATGEVFDSVSLVDALTTLLPHDNIVPLFSETIFGLDHIARLGDGTSTLLFLDGELTGAVVRSEVPVPAGGVLLLTALGSIAALARARARAAV